MSALFYLLAALTIGGGLAAVLLKNLVHAALAVTLAFAGLALLYLSLDAQFVGFAQVLVYIGGVAILIVFAILMTRGSDAESLGHVFSPGWLSGLLVAAAVFAVLGWSVIQTPLLRMNPTAPVPSATVAEIGRAFVGAYVLPLEIVALLLTAALIGGVVVAIHEKGDGKG